MATHWMSVIAALWMGALVGCGGGGGDGPGAPIPRETLLQVSPLEGSTAGGTQATLHGSGFLRPELANLRVFFGEEEALDVRVIDDRTVECVVPPGRLGPVAVNVFGMDDEVPLLAGGFRYIAALAYVADGPGALTPGLHLLDLDAGAVRLIGPIGYPIGALAVMPDGRVFGAEPVDPFRLVEIDPDSGQGTARSLLRDAATGAAVQVSDMAVLGGRLLARAADGALVEIDPASGLTVELDRHTAMEAGAALCAGPDDRLLTAPGIGSLQFHSWEAAVGLAPYGVAMDDLFGGVLRSTTAGEGLIHALQIPDRAGAHLNVLRIDPLTGAVVLVTALPSTVAAIAGDS